VLAIHPSLYISTANAANFTFANFTISPPPCQAQTIQFAQFIKPPVSTFEKEILPQKINKIMMPHKKLIFRTSTTKMGRIFPKYLHFFLFQTVLYALKDISSRHYKNEKQGTKISIFYHQIYDFNFIRIQCS